MVGILRDRRAGLALFFGGMLILTQAPSAGTLWGDDAMPDWSCKSVAEQQQMWGR